MDISHISKSNNENTSTITTRNNSLSNSDNTANVDITDKKISISSDEVKVNIDKNTSTKSYLLSTDKEIHSNKPASPEMNSVDITDRNSFSFSDKSKFNNEKNITYASEKISKDKEVNNNTDFSCNRTDDFTPSAPPLSCVVSSNNDLSNHDNNVDNVDNLPPSYNEVVDEIIHRHLISASNFTGVPQNPTNNS